MKLFEQFRRFREEQPNAPAFMISSGDRTLPISWKEFTDDIAVISWIIGKYAPNGVIGLIGENSYEWVVTHAACLFSGATVVPIEVGLGIDDIASRLKEVSANALVHSAMFADKARAVAAKLPGLATGGFGSRKTDLVIEAGKMAIACGFKTIWNRDDVDSKRVSMIVFTSGTTSVPRGTMLTLEGIETFADSADLMLKMKMGDRSLMLLPLYHIFGISTTYLMLSRGVALGVCPDFRRIYDDVERFRINYAFLVPALADVLAAKIESRGKSAEDAFGAPIDWILTGGAALPRRTYERLTALGIRTITGYGLTETTALYSIAPRDGEIRVGSAGKVSQLEGVEYKVSPAGELLIRSAAVMKGYYKNPEKTALVLDAEGWYNTGDIGHIDDDGFVWITGRASRTIVLSSGKKVAPEELEEKLLAIPGVIEALVSGEGESRDIKAELYCSIPEDSIRRALDALNRLLPVHQRISNLVIRKSPFPRTASGKIRVA